MDDTKEREEAEEAGVARSQVHSLAEGVEDAVEALRSRVDGVVQEVDKALRLPHFTKTQYENLSCPARVERVKEYTKEVDKDRKDMLERKGSLGDLSESMSEAIELLVDAFDDAASEGDKEDSNIPSNR